MKQDSFTTLSLRFLQHLMAIKAIGFIYPPRLESIFRIILKPAAAAETMMQSLS